MFLNWFFLAALAGLASNAFNFTNRFTLRKTNDSTAFAWWFEAIRLIIFSLLLFFDFFLDLSITNLFLLTSLGLTELVAVYYFMKMHSQAELSLSTIILNLRLVWVPFIAFFFIGEKLTLLEYFGIFIIFSGLSLVISPKKITHESGIKLAFLTSVISAVLTVIMKMCSSIASTSVIMVFMSLPTTLFLPFLMKNPVSRIIESKAKTIKNSFLASVFNIISMALVLWSLRLSAVGKNLAIFQATTIVSVLAGIIFLGEKRDVLKKIIGSSITIVGAWLLV